MKTTILYDFEGPFTFWDPTDNFGPMSSGQGEDKWLIRVHVLPGFGWCMLTMGIGYFPFADMFELSCNQPIAQLCLFQDWSCTLQILCTVCCFNSRIPPTLLCVPTQAACGFCISSVQESIGNTTGYPGVFQGNPCLYPSKPVPGHMGVGFEGNRSQVWVYICSSHRCDSIWQYFPPLPHSHSLAIPIYSTAHIAHHHLIARNLSDIFPCYEAPSSPLHNNWWPLGKEGLKKQCILTLLVFCFFLFLLISIYLHCRNLIHFCLIIYMHCFMDMHLTYLFHFYFIHAITWTFTHDNDWEKKTPTPSLGTITPSIHTTIDDHWEKKGWKKCLLPALEPSPPPFTWQLTTTGKRRVKKKTMCTHTICFLFFYFINLPTLQEKPPFTQRLMTTGRGRVKKKWCVLTPFDFWFLIYFINLPSLQEPPFTPWLTTARKRRVKKNSVYSHQQHCWFFCYFYFY